MREEGQKKFRLSFPPIKLTGVLGEWGAFTPACWKRPPPRTKGRCNLGSHYETRTYLAMHTRVRLSVQEFLPTAPPTRNQSAALGGESPAPLRTPSPKDRTPKNPNLTNPARPKIGLAFGEGREVEWEVKQTKLS